MFLKISEEATARLPTHIAGLGLILVDWKIPEQTV